MARHRSQAQFERARWRLRVLAPVWLLQLALLAPLMGLFAWRLGDTLKHFDERKKGGEQPVIELAWEATNVGMSFIAAACTVFEMIRFWGEVLSPWTMLFTHVVKVVCGSAIVALDVVVLLHLEDRHYSIISLGLGGAFLIIAATLLIWVIVVYRRVSVHEDYSRRSNVKGYGFNDGLDPDFAPRDRSSSFLDARRLSSNSFRRPSIDITPPADTPMGPLQRSPSYYSHQRDTQFDEYMARRGSYSGKDVEAALGAEFFGNSAASSKDEDVVVAAGVVGSGRPGQVQQRSSSTSSGHVLVAVPEEAHEGEEEDGEEDKRALLGQKRRRASSDLGGPTRESGDVRPRWQQ